MPQPKKAHPSGPKSKTRKQPSAPETADDVLAAGVDFEEAGEKWRAGDAAKSYRFFVRALDAYESGLQQFPTSFDLAYNRARLQLDLSQQPRLLRFLPSPSADLLPTALDSHRYALSLNPQDADTLFNIAQILTTLAESIIEDAGNPVDNKSARALLQEAVETFEKCLSIQVRRYGASQEAAAAFANMRDGPESASEQATSASGKTADDSASEEENVPGSEKWASIEEPVTKATLLDTCLAAIQSLTVMVPLLHFDQSALQGVEKARVDLITQAETYLDPSDVMASIEFHRTRAKSGVALVQASFEMGMITGREYAAQIDTLFDFPGRDGSAEALSDSAEARISFHGACMPHMLQLAADSVELGEVLHLCWQQLSTALGHLTTETELPNVSTPWVLYARKADVELLRVRLAGFNFTAAKSHEATMLKNAEVFYRGAKNLAIVAEEKDMAEDLAARESVLKSLRGETSGLDTALQETVLEMQGEGLLGPTHM